MVLRPDRPAPWPLTYSAVVPTTGNRPSLPGCVASVLAQTLPATEVVVVGVTGISRPPWLPQAAWFVTARASSNGQRNAGALLATGAVVLFVDDDVVLARDFAERLLAAWLASPVPVAGAAGVIDNDPRLPALAGAGYLLLGLGYTAFRARASGLRWSGHVRSVYELPEARTAGFLHGTCVGYDRRLLLTDPFDATRFDGYVMGGDLDLAARMRRRGRLLQVPDARCRVADLPTTSPTELYQQGYQHGERLAYYRWRHRGPGFLGTCCWVWANLGQVLILACRGVRSGCWLALRGYMAGLRITHCRILRGEYRRWRSAPAGRQPVRRLPLAGDQVAAYGEQVEVGVEEATDSVVGGVDERFAGGVEGGVD